LFWGGEGAKLEAQGRLFSSNLKVKFRERENDRVLVRGKKKGGRGGRRKLRQ